MATYGGNRLASLDALRGLDMCLIIGLESVIIALAGCFPESAFWQEARMQMGHVDWEGLNLYDLIFPFFVFLAGVSLHLSQKKMQEKGTHRGPVLLKLWKRALILVILGWIVNGGLEWDLDQMRYASVLGLIGISCAVAGTITLFGKRTVAIALCACALLALVWALQRYGGDMTPANCINAQIDSLYCPGILHYGTYDPEGLLCLVSATALTLLGFLAGNIFTLQRPPAQTLSLLVLTGAIFIVLGSQGPIIKNIWTPFFVLTTAGIGCLLLGLFHLIIEVAGWKAWCFPLRVVGLNALFIYVLTHIIPFQELGERLFSGSVRHLVEEPWQPVAQSLCTFFLAWLLCYALYRRNILIKI